MPMTDEQLTVLQHKILNAEIEKVFPLCDYSRLTVEDKKTLLALCETEREATRFYLAEFKRLNPKKTKKVNYPEEAAAATKAASDAKWAFLKAKGVSV